MTYTFTFEPDYSRIMMACIIDARASIPAIKNQVGSVIKDYVDEQLAMINSDSIVYKIETELGVLAGFFALQVNIKNKTATLITQVLRPAFKTVSEIPVLIGNFINITKVWQQDYLF